jgi:hypothetical protein
MCYVLCSGLAWYGMGRIGSDTRFGMGLHGPSSEVTRISGVMKNKH